MKRILSILLLSFCANALAAVDYTWTSLAFPDETSTKGLPAVIPCVTKTAQDGKPLLVCTWMETSREVLIWDAQRQQDVRYVNQVGGTCLRGKCRTSNAIVGQWNQDGYFRLSIWYQIGVSTDGLPVAYRIDTNKQVSYLDAGISLLQFYLDIGVPDDQIRPTFENRYQGGYQGFRDAGGYLSSDPLDLPPTNVTASATQSEWPEVKTAWCNPRMDDDCYINGKKVPIAELGKWLPDVAESNIDQIGGYCETILCFDKDNQPIGYLLQ